MKTKVLILAIILTVLRIGIANSQIAPTIQRASLSKSDRAIIDKHLSHYTAFSMDLKGRRAVCA